MDVPILKIPFTEDDADHICRELKELLVVGHLAMGRHCRDFEKAFAQFCGVNFALGCSNGTAALEMIFRALDLAGASVAVPATTFMASALAPLAAGAKIILVDCDPEYFQLCPDDLERKIRPDTKAVLLVHLGGFISPHLERLKKICRQAGAALIEDAAHAHGAETAEGQKAGSLGLAAAFSFFPTKVLTTAEGGMVTTDEAGLAETMRAIRQHGQREPGSNLHQIFGLNYRPSELHALLGLVMMKKAQWILERRRQAAAIYDELLRGGPLKPITAPPGQKAAYYKYMALLPEGVDRLSLKRNLKERYGVSLAGEVYAHSLDAQPLWQNRPELLAAPISDMPVSHLAAARQICLPLYPDISRPEQEYVVEKLWLELKKSL